jgi:hypothetical protein
MMQHPIDAAPFIAPLRRHIVRDAPQRPRGFVFLPLRDIAGGVHAAVAVHETTHGSSFELPVVREGEFKNLVLLEGIPTNPRYRVSLRIYALEDPEPLISNYVDVVIHGVETIAYNGGARIAPLIRLKDDEPYFGSVPDVFALPQFGPVSEASGLAEITVWSNAQRIWAFASIVDNETQQSRIVTPMK